MKSLTIIAGRSLPVWVDGTPIQVGNVLEEDKGWNFDNPDLSYIGLKFPLDEFHQGKNPDEVMVMYKGHVHILRVDFVLSPPGECDFLLHGENFRIDETQTIIHATVK